MHFGSTKWIVIACSTGMHIGIDKCSGPPISPGPGEIPPPPPPLSGPECGTCMYVHIMYNVMYSVCVRVCEFVCECVYDQVHVHMYVCVCVCVCVCVYHPSNVTVLCTHNYMWVGLPSRVAIAPKFLIL